MSAVAAMKQQRLEHALRGVPLSEEQQRSLVAASHGLDAEWTDWIAELIEVARSAQAGVAGPEGDWMQTFTGRAFYPLAPRAEDINPLDIAHALSLLCRYGGHVTRFYSVAEHCVLMSEAVAPENALWALIHDATEAYLGDMIRPLKSAMLSYRAVEDQLTRVICNRLGLEVACPAEVKAADARILLDERDALMTKPPQPWAVDHLAPLGVAIRCWSPEEAEKRYLERLRELLSVGLLHRIGGDVSA